MQALKQRLLKYLRREDLLQAILLCGKVEDPDFDYQRSLNIIFKLTARVFEGIKGHEEDAIYKVKKINEVLFEHFKLIGRGTRSKKVIDNADQYYLHHVLSKKRGCPLSFTILYKILSEQVGMETKVLSFPANYLLKVKDGKTNEFYVDAFDKGRLLTSEEFQKKFRAAMQRNKLMSTHLFETINCYQLVGKLLQQLKHVYILKSDALHAVRAVEMLSAIHPDSPELARDRGILYCEMEYFSKAADDLKFYLRSRPKADDVKEIKKLAGMLRGFRETMN